MYLWPTGKTSATNGLAELAYQFSPELAILPASPIKPAYPPLKTATAQAWAALCRTRLKTRSGAACGAGRAWRALGRRTGEASLFYTDIKEAIQTAVVNSNACGSTPATKRKMLAMLAIKGWSWPTTKSLGAACKQGWPTPTSTATTSAIKRTPNRHAQAPYLCSSELPATCNAELAKQPRGRTRPSSQNYASPINTKKKRVLCCSTLN